MKIGSVLENQKIEKRISITPDIIKKYTSLGFEILDVTSGQKAKSFSSSIIKSNKSL